MCTIREQHSPNTAINPPKKWNRKSLGLTNITEFSFSVGTAQIRPWEPQQHLVHRFAMRSNPSYLEMQIKHTMLFLNINNASINCCLSGCFFQAELAVPVVLCNPPNPHAYCSLRSQGNRTGTQTSLLPKACLCHGISLKATPFGSIFFHY